jgi:hypothetical protein
MGHSTTVKTTGNNGQEMVGKMPFSRVTSLLFVMCSISLILVSLRRKKIKKTQTGAPLISAFLTCAAQAAYLPGRLQK